uniref:Uncharacterized protein n=1 Tax=Anopheles coluzzii TaxID=1518534 RepID=A0A8W7P0I5_ANOCL
MKWISDDSRRFRAIPGDSGRFWTIPGDSGRFRAIPGDSEGFRAIPSDSGPGFQTIPDGSNDSARFRRFRRFQTIPDDSGRFRLVGLNLSFGTGCSVLCSAWPSIRFCLELFWVRRISTEWLKGGRQSKCNLPAI